MADDDKQILDLRQLGQTGLKRFSGFIYEEFLEELTGWRGVAVYKEMGSNDPTVGAVLFAIEMLCRRTSFRAEPASNQPYDVEAADFLQSCMDDMSQTWIDTVSEILTMLQYGYSYHEIVYKRRCGDVVDPSMRSKHTDGRVGWRKLPMRSQDTIYRWQFDDHGGIQGAEQLAPPHYYLTTIPIEKALLFRTGVNKNNPEGRSILRTAYRPWYLKKNIENIEGVGIERDLAGLPVALVPPELLSSGATSAQRALLENIKNIVTNIRRDEQEGVVFPAAYDEKGNLLYKLELMSSGGERQFNTNDIIMRYDQRIAMTSLADFLLLGQQKVGSFALHSSKTKLFATAIGAYLDIICETFNRYAIPRLFALNDFQTSELPTIQHGDLEDVDLAELGDYITKLAGSGYPLFPNMELEQYLMKVANLPEPMSETTVEEDLKVQPKPETGRTQMIEEIPPDPIKQPPNENYQSAAEGGDVENTPLFNQEVAAGERARKPKETLG